MGKQSRKPGKANKKNHKAKIEERKNNILAASDSNVRIEGDNQGMAGSLTKIDKQTILVGDVVWFNDSRSDENNHNTRRGIIREIHYDTSSRVESYSIQHLKHFFEENMETWKVNAKLVTRDLHNWTTRFDVGDQVVSNTDYGWLPATITNLWPVWEENPKTDDIPIYKMICHPSKTKSQEIAAPRDADYCVQKYPSSFRFSVDDKVSVNLLRAKHKGGSIPKGVSRWAPSTIKKVDILGLREFYAVYECEYQTNGYQFTCWVPYDTDEYVAAMSANPRERLMDSIRQDCNYNHFKYLFQETGIEAYLIQDLIISKAIEFGCFAVLRWLEYDLNLELASLQFGNGNTILHQIAQLKSCHTFLKGFARNSFEHDALSGFSLTSRYKNDKFAFWKRKNDSGETFLDLLFKTGDLRVLDCLFSPGNGLFWVLDKRFENEDWYKSTEAVYHRFSPQGLLVSRALENTAIHSQISAIEFLCMDTEEEAFLEKHLMKDLNGPHSIEAAKKLIRFVDLWAEHYPTNDLLCRSNIMRELALSGFYQMFRSLVKADPSLLEEKARIGTAETHNEFVQEEIYPTVKGSHGDWGLQNIPTMVICGHAPHRPYIESWKGYLALLRDLIRDKSSDSLLNELETYLTRNGNCHWRIEEIVRYQIQLLQDPPTLPGRLQIMDYLVNNRFFKSPCPLLPIRMRQCGVFRWLVEKGHLLLDERALNQLNSPEARKVEFLGGQRVPASVSSGTFLCFACVEYDSLFTLQWLVKDNSVSLDGQINGFNILHTCAYFGRLEIIWWLHGLLQWPALASEPSSRKGFEKQSALHVALSRGFTNAVEFMLTLGHTVPEGKRLSLESMALKSLHEHVRTWGQERSRHVGLNKDVGKLLKMLSEPGDYQSIKQFIHSSGCMMKNRWTDAELYRDDQPLPGGTSFRAVLMKCFETDDDEFALWLCHEVTSNAARFGPRHRTLKFGFEFWTGRFFHSTTKQLSFDKVIEECLDDELVEYSRQPWARRFKIENPDDHPFISKGTLSIVLSQRFREELLILLICNSLLDLIQDEISLRIMSGAYGDALTKLHSMGRRLVQKSITAEHSIHKLEDYYTSNPVFTIDGHVNLGFYFYGASKTYSETHLIRFHWPLKQNIFHELPLYCFVAIENYTQLIEWLYINGEGWSSDKEIEMVRIASYLGHDDLVDILQAKALYSSSHEIMQAMLLGAGEAGREMLCLRLLHDKQLCELVDSVLAEFSSSKVERAAQEAADNATGMDFFDAKRKAENEFLLSSLPAVIVHGYMSCRLQNGDDLSPQSGKYLSILRALATDHGHSPFSFFEAAVCVLNNSYKVEFWESTASLCEFLHNELSLNFGERQHKSTLVEFSTRILEGNMTHSRDKEVTRREVKVTKDLLCAFVSWGLDIQSIKVRSCFEDRGEDCHSFLSALQEKQRAGWIQFDLIKVCRPLEEICHAFKSGSLTLNGTDRDGQKLVHLAAAYDRVDVLEWLVESDENLLEQKDHAGRTAIDSAMASKARASTDWLQRRQARKILSFFLKRHVRRRLAATREAKYIFAIQRLQSRHRGRLVRRTYRANIISRVEGGERYRAIWATPVSILTCANTELPTWSSLRSKRENRSCEIDGIDEILESRKALEVSVVDAFDEEAPDDFAIDETTDDKEEYAVAQLHTQMTPLSNTTIFDSSLPCTSIHLSTDVVKWFMRADGKFQKLFINKIDRLRMGERSRKLAKALRGSVSVIYESYLEQKSGQRVLWQQEKDGTIFIWYVAKHKNVSRLMRLIDDCKRRAFRQRISTTSLQESTCNDHQVRLDPLGNVPLKVYEVHADKLFEMLDDGWVPKLCLSPEERDIVESRGTVLLLGRSGTGKTVCICNRIDLDFWRFQRDPNFKQLFVARSRRLCRYVAETVGKKGRMGFVVYLELMRSLEEKLPVLGLKREVFLPSLKMDFARFKREVYCGKAGTAKSLISIDPLVVWTHIRTILKGSIEALDDSDSCHCDKASFMSFGKKRCRLCPGDRESVYKIFTWYQNFTKAHHLWDDCDRTVSLLKRLNHAIQSNHPVMNDLRQSKLYIDEIQDYTQAEILLFFRISGPGDLFLAGDPAQSVVEGVDFRFEEIRSVGYHVAGNRCDLIPQKPKTLTTNFRSHSGVLDVAAAILRRMFDTFPDSAKQLGEDRGVFNGPRPGVFHSVAVSRLRALVSEKLRGVIVLTHDSSASYWKKTLDYELVYGVRAAKGLEFKSVIVLDFFTELPSGVQKPWRDLILGRGGDAPELEGQLKLLYTAVTRCIERLFFAETRPSSAGDAFVRWLTTTSIRPTILATRQNIDNIEKMAMTQDEWVASGLDNAESAEMHSESNDLAEAQTMVEKAIFCFEEGKDMALARKARTYRVSLTFRAKIQVEYAASEAVDIRATEVLEQLGAENLLLEARRLLDAILPLLDEYAREQLEKGILRDPVLDAEKMLL